MDEFIKKFPELIKILLEKISQSEICSDIPDAKKAKNRLLIQLQSFTDEIACLQNREGIKLTEEQIKKLTELRPSLQWTIKPRG